MDATVFVAATLDGFIARRDGGLDWLEATAGDEDYGFGDLMASIDALVMGRITFEVARTAGVWHYGDTPVFVLTHRDLEIPAGWDRRVEALTGSARQVAEGLAERGMERICVDGGEVIQAFLRAGYVRRIVITRIPVLIGRGIPLFGPLGGDIALRLVRSEAYANSWTQVEYEVIGGP